MRAFFVVAIVGVMGGCTSTTEGTGPAPNACEAKIYGSWTVTDALSVDDKRCINVPATGSWPVTIDHDGWHEANDEGVVSKFEIAGFAADTTGLCAVFSAKHVAPVPDAAATLTTLRMLTFDTDTRQMTGNTTVTLADGSGDRCVLKYSTTVAPR